MLKVRKTPEQAKTEKEVVRRQEALSNELTFSDKEVLVMLHNIVIALMNRRKVPMKLEAEYLQKIMLLGDSCVRDIAEDLVADGTLTWRDVSLMLAGMSLSVEAKLNSTPKLTSIPFARFQF